MTPTPLARRMIEPIRQSLQGLEVTLSKVDRFDPAATWTSSTDGEVVTCGWALLHALEHLREHAAQALLTWELWVHSHPDRVAHAAT